MSDQLRVRPRVTLPQLECLWKFLNGHKEIATGFNKAATARETSKRLWKAIALNLNSFDGATKNWKEWSKYWNNYKSKLKIKIASLKSQNNGVVPIDSDQLANIEKKFLLIMGTDKSEKNTGMMDSYEQESSDNSLESIYYPDTVLLLKAEPKIENANSVHTHSDSSTSQADSAFQQIFEPEQSKYGQVKSATVNDLSGLKKELIPETNWTGIGSNARNSETVRRGFLSSQQQRDSAVRSQRRSLSRVPRRRQLYRSGEANGLHMAALRMMLRNSRRQIILMQQLARHAAEIKDLLLARFPLPPERH